MAISINGRGRVSKDEEVYLRHDNDGWQARKSLAKYFDFYRDERPPHTLGSRTPSQIYAEGCRDESVHAQFFVEVNSERTIAKKITTRKQPRGRATPLIRVSRATTQ